MRLAPVCSWTDRFDSPMRLRERVLAESRDAVNSRCIHSILDFSERNGALYVSTYLGVQFYTARACDYNQGRRLLCSFALIFQGRSWRQNARLITSQRLSNWLFRRNDVDSAKQRNCRMRKIIPISLQYFFQGYGNLCQARRLHLGPLSRLCPGIFLLNV